MPKNGGTGGLGSGTESGADNDETLVFEPATDMPADSSAFDFETFEQSEAAAAREAEERLDTAEEPTDQPPEQRVTVRRSYLPPGDVVVDARPVGNMTVVTMRGRINEAFRGSELGRTLSGVVVFDLAEVDRVSSFGVKGWLQMLEASRMSTCYFFRCSEAVVNQITMMRNFCGPGRIHSILAPYTCTFCGEEFGTVYDSVADREYLLGRSPASVECPSCQHPAEMDDDPWAYFALDEHLLMEVPPDLEQVLDHLTASNRVDPIEKFISDQETRIRFNAPLDGKLRMRRAFAGLEGRVTLDLSVTPSIDAAGLERLVAAVRELEPDVTAIWLDGAKPEVVRAFLDAQIPRVFVATMFVEARCPANGIQRAVLVDVERKRSGLKAGQLPPIEANWAAGPLDIADAELLFRAAIELAPQEEEPPSQTAPAVATGATKAAPNALVWQAAALAAVLSLAGAALVVVIAFWLYTNNLPPSTAATVIPTPAPVVDQQVDGWDGGNPLPPPWVEQAFVLEGDQLLVVGVAEGTDVDEVAERSRQAALRRIVDELRQRVGATVAAGGLSDSPETDDAVVVARFVDQVGAWAAPERVNAAIKRTGSTVTVATQHQISKESWDQLIAHYTATVSFRGLTVGRRFPTDFGTLPPETTPLVVVGAESWFREARQGDGIISVQELPVSDPAEFANLAQQSFDQVRDGGRINIQIYHDDARRDVAFSKQAAATPRPSRPFDLLPLEAP